MRGSSSMSPSSIAVAGLISCVIRRIKETDEKERRIQTGSSPARLRRAVYIVSYANPAHSPCRDARCDAFYWPRTTQRIRSLTRRSKVTDRPMVRGVYGGGGRETSNLEE